MSEVHETDVAFPTWDAATIDELTGRAADQARRLGARINAPCP